MSTSYFMRTNACDCCGRADELHIGNTAIGWRMMLRVYDDPWDDGDPKIKTWAGWKAALNAADGIRDEYGKPVTYDEFVAMAESRADLKSDDYGTADGPVDLIPGAWS